VEEAPIEITGFSMPEVDQIVGGEEPAAVEEGSVGPRRGSRPVARLGDCFCRRLGTASLRRRDRPPCSGDSDGW